MFFLQFGESAAFCRSDDPGLFPESDFPLKLADSTSHSNSPDLEIFTTPMAYKVRSIYICDFICFDYDKDTHMSVRNTGSSCFQCTPLPCTCVCCGRQFVLCDIERQKSPYMFSRPMSKGTLRLKSADPFADPVMDPQYVSISTK